MKLFLVSILMLFSLSSCATSGTSVGNGLIAKPISKVDEVKPVEEKTISPEELCSKEGGKVEKVNGTLTCVLKDKTNKSLDSLKPKK
jgi:hypothetical protein